MTAEEYLVRMLASLEPDGVPFPEAYRSHGLIDAVRNCLRGCRWELLEEAYATLGQLIANYGLQEQSTPAAQSYSDVR
jgi:hypothetical protein